jgi:arylsulfatase A-like enzyme
MPDPRPLRRLVAALLLATLGAVALLATPAPDRTAAATSPDAAPATTSVWAKAAAAARRPAQGRRGKRSHPAQALGPNIVMVLTDDLTADLIEFMPEVQRMQAEGVSFDRFFVADSLCCPSRASLLTGRLPHNTGVLSNVWPTGGRRAFAVNGGEDDNVAIDLQSRGYRTAMLGKYLNEYLPTTDGVPPGWDRWVVSGKGYHGFRYKLNVDGGVERRGTGAKAYLTNVLREQSLRFIDESVAEGRPFYLQVDPFTPHGPATPAPQDRGKFLGLQAPRGPAWDAEVQDGPGYLAGRGPLTPAQIRAIDHRFVKRAQSVLAIDRMLGAIRRRLEERGVAQRTYVVFTSDNGFHLGERRLMPGKMTPFDHDVRVPLIVTGPGVPAGGRVSALTQNTDLRPTFTELAGTAPFGEVDGRSLAPALHGETLYPWRRAALIEHHDDGLAPGDPDWQRKPGGNPPSYGALRTADGLYVESANGEREFYDLRTDPAALRNVFGELSLVRRTELSAQLAQMTSCAGPDSCLGGG